MANVTDPLARHIHGTNPQNLLEYITRQKIYDCRYWKEESFGLAAVDIDRSTLFCACDESQEIVDSGALRIPVLCSFEKFEQHKCLRKLRQAKWSRGSRATRTRHNEGQRRPQRTAAGPSNERSLTPPWK